MYLSTARAITPEQKDGFRGKAPKPASFEMASRLAKMPYVEAMVLEGRAKFVHTPVPDGTCETKSRVAGLPMGQILTIAFFDVRTKEEERQGIPPKTYGIIRAASERLDSKALTAFDISTKQAKRAKPSSELPVHMRSGTCTPFLSKESVGKISGLVFVGSVDSETLMDISIGGKDEAAHEYSVQMKYADMVDLVKQQFGSSVQIAESN